VIIPEGGRNQVAVDMLISKIRSVLTDAQSHRPQERRGDAEAHRGSQ
jgi:hypothetical protein